MRNTYLVIGSRSVDLKRNLSRDADIVCSYEAYKELLKSLSGEVLEAMPTLNGEKCIISLNNESRGFDKIEVSITWPGSLAEDLFDIVSFNTLFSLNRSLIVFQSLNANANWLTIDADVMYMLKMSHRFLKNSPHFLKTMYDIKYLRKLGASIPKVLKEHYLRRQKEQYWYSHPKLNVSKKEFFSDDGVNYIYDHDSIHESIVLPGNKPVWTAFSCGQVMSSKEAFFGKLSQSERLLAVLEESCVLAIERSYAPYPDVLTYKQAFDKALEKVCTSITSGWFREFAWEHYDEVQALYDEIYFKRFDEARIAGRVKLFKEIV